VAVLELLGPQTFEAISADIAGLCGVHGRRVLRIRGQGSMIVLVLVPSAADWAIGPRARSGGLPGLL
jgi:hypothetical protein